MRKGMTGLIETYASTRMKMTKNATKTIRLAQTFGSDQGRLRLFLKLSARRNADMQMMRVIDPNQSISLKAPRFEVA